MSSMVVLVLASADVEVVRGAAYLAGRGASKLSSEFKNCQRHYLDFQKLGGGGCIYYREWFKSKNKKSTYERLAYPFFDEQNLQFHRVFREFEVLNTPKRFRSALQLQKKMFQN